MTGKSGEDISDLVYEARSKKDPGWHDVSLFVNFRNLSTGELEALVRYIGYGKEYDEWIDVKTGIRERSIPLEASNCKNVKDGDLALCLQERDDHALYCDARVVNIKRSDHNATECMCIFTVQFLHDNSEEAIRWNKIWCRPTQEEHVVDHKSSKPTIEEPSLRG